MKDIYVQVQGGVVQNVRRNAECPDDIRVVIVDFDTEGADLNGKASGLFGVTAQNTSGGYVFCYNPPDVLDNPTSDVIACVSEHDSYNDIEKVAQRNEQRFSGAWEALSNE